MNINCDQQLPRKHTILTMSWKVENCRLYQRMNAKLIPHCEIKHTCNVVMANAFLIRFLCFPRPPLWPGHNFTMSGCIRASCTTSRPSKHVTASNSPGDISMVPKGEEQSQMELDETSMILRDCEFDASLSWSLLLIRVFLSFTTFWV